MPSPCNLTESIDMNYEKNKRLHATALYTFHTIALFLLSPAD